MDFDELMDKVWESSCLPKIAREQLPRSLSDKTKKKLVRKPAIEIARIFQTVISEINDGSVNSIDTLVNDRLYT